MEDEPLSEGEETGNDGEDDDNDEVNVGNWNINFDTLTANDVMELEFRNPLAAYHFYNEYSRCNGFSVRRSKTVKNSKGESVRYTFVCSRQGFRDEKWLKKHDRKRKHKAVTRCGC